MAGVKGRSGGARPGSGRPKKEPTVIIRQVAVSERDDPKAFLSEVMRNEALDVKVRMDAARTLMPYHYAKKVEVPVTKKEQQEIDAVMAHRDSGWGAFLGDSPAQ